MCPVCFLKTYDEPSPLAYPTPSPQASLWGWGVDQCEGSCSISKDTRGFSLVSDLNHSGGFPNGWKLDFPNIPTKIQVSLHMCSNQKVTRPKAELGDGPCLSFHLTLFTRDRSFASHCFSTCMPDNPSTYAFLPCNSEILFSPIGSVHQPVALFLRQRSRLLTNSLYVRI
jgi:hypothetical protein